MNGLPSEENVTTREKIEQAVAEIKKDRSEREAVLLASNENVKAERLRQRTEYDIEMLLETGYTTGIENYVRYLNNREPGAPPETLLDYFPDDLLLFIDESHMTIPQIGGMSEGNKSRKQTLIEYGFRLPSSHDNRPLKFSEFDSRFSQHVYIPPSPAH